MPIAIATKEDIHALVKLLNSAYRGEASTKGWTTEAHLLKGELRTDEATLSAELENNAVMLKYTNEDAITGCVYLRKDNDKIYLGMLSVSPTAQSQGVGKKLLAASEEYAVSQHCKSIYMTVISVREELIAWYKKNGYQATGETKPFTVNERFGVPTQQLEFMVYKKNIL